MKFNEGLALETSSGNDLTFFWDCWCQKLAIDSGANDDQVMLYRFESSSAEVACGAGADAVSLIESEFFGKTYFDGGPGGDKLIEKYVWYQYPPGFFSFLN